MPQFTVMTTAGFVTLVGAGPGDPDLLTLAAARALRQADVVLYDALVSEAVLRHCPGGAERVAVGKRAGAHSMAQDEINALLIGHARQGKRVVRLKGGDPFVFGRGGEEALACREAGIPFAVIPGVTSATAVPAHAGIPVTHRGLARSFAVVTGSETTGAAEVDWAALARLDTVVILMGAATLADAAAKLIEAGRDPATPAAAISHGTLPGQVVVVATLGAIAQAVQSASLPTPMITVVGEVAALATQLAWRHALPLAGKRVVVTRTREQASELKEMIAALGAEVIEAPVLRIEDDTGDLTTDGRVASRWDWVVFTSQNAVAAFFRALERAGRDARALGATKVAAIGPATAEALRGRGVIADFQPSAANSACLAAELPRAAGARVLLGVGSLSGPELADGLRARGAHVERVLLYRTGPMPLSPELSAAVLSAHAVTFASASSAKFLRLALGEQRLPGDVSLCAIGPQAAAATREAFGRVDAVAREPSLASLVEAVVGALS